MSPDGDRQSPRDIPSPNADLDREAADLDVITPLLDLGPSLAPIHTRDYKAGCDDRRDKITASPAHLPLARLPPNTDTTIDSPRGRPACS